MARPSTAFHARGAIGRMQKGTMGEPASLAIAAGPAGSSMQPSRNHTG